MSSWACNVRIPIRLAPRLGRRYVRFFKNRFTSCGVMRSGDVQPSRSYSAMHWSANPRIRSSKPLACAICHVAKRTVSLAPR